jgi:hypothetical protein
MNCGCSLCKAGFRAEGIVEWLKTMLLWLQEFAGEHIQFQEIFQEVEDIRPWHEDLFVKALKTKSRS